MKRWCSTLSSSLAPAALAGALVLALAATGCSDDSKAAADAATPGADGATGDAAAAPDGPAGQDLLSASRDLAPYERPPAPAPITGHGWTHKEMGPAVLPAGAVPFEVSGFGAA